MSLFFSTYAQTDSLLHDIPTTKKEFTGSEPKVIGTINYLVAGVRSAIKFYKAGNGLKKNKEMEKVIKIDDGGGLEGWVTEQLGKK